MKLIEEVEKLTCLRHAQMTTPKRGTAPIFGSEQDYALAIQKAVQLSLLHYIEQLGRKQSCTATGKYDSLVSECRTHFDLGGE